MLNERGASPALVRIQASPPSRSVKQDELIDAQLDCRCKVTHLPVAQLEQSGWLRTSRSGVRVFPGRPLSALGIVAVQRAFNPQTGVRFSQGGPRWHGSDGRARPCDGRGRAFESPQPCHPFGVRLTGRTQDFESWGPGSNPGRRASDAVLVQLAGRETLTLEIVVRIHGAVPTRLAGQSSNGRMAVSKTADRGSNPCWPANPRRVRNGQVRGCNPRHAGSSPAGVSTLPPVAQR